MKPIWVIKQGRYESHTVGFIETESEVNEYSELKNYGRPEDDV